MRGQGVTEGAATAGADAPVVHALEAQTAKVLDDAPRTKVRIIDAQRRWFLSQLLAEVQQERLDILKGHSGGLTVVFTVALKRQRFGQRGPHSWSWLWISG